ncbi:MAG: SGNH/GDSL hydrolase family protein [Marmoricola sp.]
MFVAAKVAARCALAVSVLVGLATAAGPAVADGSLSYVALGDSYTAAPFVPDTDMSSSCLQSSSNYPHQLAAALGADLTDRSCSGAKTTDMTATQPGSAGPQFDALGPDTDLVTVSIGGNDFDVFSTLIGACSAAHAAHPQATAPCRKAERSHGRDRLLAAVARTSKRDAAVLRRIRVLAPNARVVVVGYPELAPRRGTCPDLLPFAPGDYRYANQVGMRLNQALRHAAAVTHAAYIDVFRASKGHDICSADPWVNGQHFDPSRALQYHPFLNEQTAVAKLIERRLTRH